MNREADREGLEVVIITGMSGAGKTVAIQSFEDLGFYCVDNLPPALLETFIELMATSGRHGRRLAVVVDLRVGELFGGLGDAIDRLEALTDVRPVVLFLDADNQTIVSRYKESRRSHPLAPGGLLLGGIKKETDLLMDLRVRANFIIDTSNLAPKELRAQIRELFSQADGERFAINVMSFGFKHGVPIDADLVFDVRFLPNPHYIEELRPRTGLDRDVASYVLQWPQTRELIRKLEDLFDFLIPQYKAEGKSQLVIAFGCTGGQHRSVTFAEYFYRRLRDHYKAIATHREIQKRVE